MQFLFSLENFVNNLGVKEIFDGFIRKVNDKLFFIVYVLVQSIWYWCY